MRLTHKNSLMRLALNSQSIIWGTAISGALSGRADEEVIWLFPVCESLQFDQLLFAK